MEVTNQYFVFKTQSFNLNRVINGQQYNISQGDLSTFNPRLNLFKTDLVSITHYGYVRNYDGRKYSRNSGGINVYINSSLLYTNMIKRICDHMTDCVVLNCNFSEIVLCK